MSAVEQVIERVRRTPAAGVNAAMGAAIFLVGGLALILPGDYAAVPASQRPGAFTILAIEALAVALRRRKLWLAYTLIVLASLSGLFRTNEFYTMYLAQIILLYTVSERRGLGVSLLALIASLVMRALPWWYETHGHIPVAQALGTLADAYFPALALVWFAGRIQARRRAQSSELERSADELRDERERLARRAVATERARIARDLHALILRSVQSMRIETRSARRELNSDPGRASEMMAFIEATGRRALVEMRRLLMVLRGATRDPVLSLAHDASQTISVSSSDNDLHQGSSTPMTDPRVAFARPVQRARQWVAISWVSDVLIVLVMAIFAMGERFWDPSGGLMQRRSVVVLAAVAVGALLFRRVAPVSVLLLIGAVIFAQNAFLGGDPNTADRAILVAVFTVSALRGPWWGLAAIGVEVLAYAPFLVIPASGGGLAALVGWSTIFVFAVIAGLGVREGRQLNAKLREQNEELRRTRGERVRLAVDEERTRVARDVHDMVAHGVTLMVIQAGAARWLAPADPGRADEALRSVERAGHESIRELHALVGSLGASPRTGAPPLPVGDELTIPWLVDHEVVSGMHIDLVVSGGIHDLDPGLELSLYRIVQEALTNVRKHASGARVLVDLTYTLDGVEVEVTDGGGSNPTPLEPTVPGAGQGLVGIAERAALFGGHVEAGPTPEGGFRVRASLHEERVPV